MTPKYYDTLETPFGWMGLLSSETGLLRTSLPEKYQETCILRLGIERGQDTRAPERFEDLRDRLLSYFAGSVVEFRDIVLDIDDAPQFHRKAWEVCRAIPPGETRTYKWLAKMAGSPNAARAAGQTMARNRVPIIVPCHRVVGSDGSMRGFGSGDSRVDLKRQLLELEGAGQRLL